jgi:3-oxoacyl-[acyl-carrier protein] reductase
MDLNLKGKSCLVTGGAQGLGRALCLNLAREGVRIAVNYRSSAKRALETVREIQELGVDAFAVAGDISREEDVSRIFREAACHMGGIDLLVNNSGVCPTSFIKDMALAEWEDVIAVNLTGTFLTCREMVRHLLSENRTGRIVNICSQAAINGSANGKAHYSASKGGVLSFTLSLAKEASRYGIAVNALAPGMVYTGMIANKKEEELAQYEKDIPIGRIATQDEIARAAVFLLSDAAGYMTGSLLDVSGGMIGR